MKYDTESYVPINDIKYLRITFKHCRLNREEFHVNYMKITKQSHHVPLTGDWFPNCTPSTYLKPITCIGCGLEGRIFVPVITLKLNFNYCTWVLNIFNMTQG